MIVYHGSLEIVKNPDIQHFFRPLDFGKGFYVTTVILLTKLLQNETGYTVFSVFANTVTVAVESFVKS